MRDVPRICAVWMGVAAHPPLPLSVLAIRLFTSIDLQTRPQAAAAATIATALTVAVAAVALHYLRRSAAWK